MSGPDTIVQSVPTEARVPDEAALVKALQVLYRAYQKLSIYPENHPAIPQALSEAAAAFHLALKPDAPLTVGVSRDTLSVGDQTLGEVTGALESLALVLHDADVAALEFRSGVSGDELGFLVTSLAQARRDNVRGQDFVDSLEEAEFTNLNVVPVDYRVLQFSDGVRQPGDELNVWERFSSLLLDSEGSDDGTMPPETMAEQVMLEIERHEGAGIGLLQKRLQRVSQRINRLSAQERAAVRERMAKFVTALTPRLRRDLLRMDLSAPDDSLPVMFDLLDVVPEPDLLEALQQIDNSGGRMSRQVMALMNKLARVSTERPTLAAGLRDTLAKWGVPLDGLADASGQNLQEVLEEVFQRRDQVDCNPVPYQGLLEDLSRTALRRSEVELQSRYVDPENDDETRAHASRVAIQTLTAPGGDAFRPGLLAFLSTTADDLIDTGRFEVLRDAALAAKTYVALKSAAPESRKAAARFLGEFDRPERIGRILRQARHDQPMPGAAISLLGLGGNTALEAVVAHLEEAPKGPAAESLRRFLVDRGEEFVAWVDGRLDQGWNELERLVGFVEKIGPKDSIPLFERMQRHEEAAVRQAAFRLLCQRDRRSGASERYIRRALKDRDPALIGAALQRLTGQDGDEALEILADVVEGSPRNLTDRIDYRQQAVALLGRRGEGGIRLLCGALDTLARCLKPIDVRVARGVADQLAAHRDIPRVAESLRRWRVSRARIVSILLRRNSPRGKQA